MILDVYIVETQNGGDAVLQGRDFLKVSGWENMIYLAMFGGNVEQSTESRNESEQAFDWWANQLLMPDQPEIQFNSETEHRLMNVALNSAGRLLVEQSINKDLEFMKAFAEIRIETAITGPNRLEIRIYVKEPDQLQEQIYIYLWDGLSQSLALVSNNQNLGGDFNIDYNFDFNS